MTRIDVSSHHHASCMIALFAYFIRLLRPLFFSSLFGLSIMSSTTTFDSHRMPAEWEPHEACLILYPHNSSTFQSDCRPVQDEILHLVHTIATHGNEDIVLFCNSDKIVQELQEKFENDTRIVVANCSSDDTWARDTGPTFVVNSSSRSLIGLDWDFNAYGGKEEGCYWPCELDKQVCHNMCQFLSKHYDTQISTRKIPLVLEGGSIHTNGQGTVLTTEECLLNPNRNPHLSKSDIESIVLSALGCTKMIWLPLGLAFDNDTNGHVDNIACFSQPSHVILSWTDDEKGDVENYTRCRQAMKVLENEKDAQGRNLTIHKLYLPPPLYYTKEEVETLAPDSDGLVVARTAGERLAASYVNFYIANDAVIVPQFGVEPHDSQAIRVLQQVFPGRNVVGIASREILLGGGNIHCQTQQMPKI